MAKIMKISHENAIGGKVNPLPSPSINIRVALMLIGILLRERLFSLYIVVNHCNFQSVKYSILIWAYLNYFLL